MKFFTNKYSNAVLWQETLKLREDKKNALLLVQPVEITEIVIQAPVQKEVIFTQEDRGHSAEEAQKIQNIYTKLKGFGFAPTYAGF